MKLIGKLIMKESKNNGLDSNANTNQECRLHIFIQICEVDTLEDLEEDTLLLKEDVVNIW